jgi:hypothetical protein
MADSADPFNNQPQDNAGQVPQDSVPPAPAGDPGGVGADPGAGVGDGGVPTPPVDPGQPVPPAEPGQPEQPEQPPAPDAPAGM